MSPSRGRSIWFNVLSCSEGIKKSFLAGALRKSIGFEKAAITSYLMVKDVEEEEALAAAVRELHKPLAH